MTIKIIDYDHTDGEIRQRVPRGAKGGGKDDGGDFRAPIEAPNSLQSAAHAKLIEVLGEGPINGPIVNDAGSIFESIFYNDTPIESSDGSFNFVGLDITFKPGTPNQTAVPGFPRIEAEKFLDPNEVTKEKVVTHTTEGGDELDAVRPKLRIPALTDIDPDTGDLIETFVSISVEVSAWNPVAMSFGPFVTKRTIFTQGKTTSPYEDSFRINLPKSDTEAAPWQIRMVRNTDNWPGPGNLNNRTFFPSVTEITDEVITYSDSAIVATDIDARQFGTTVPSRTYLVEGLQILIPSNYDPDTRIYTGIWDGTFKTAYTNNPAWVYYDIVTNRRYGLGRLIPPEKIDKFLLYTIAKECDRLVDDGLGGLEPLYRFNGVINTRNDAIVVLQTILSNFHAILYWGEGAISLAQDAAADPVRIVTKANTIDGLFTYGGTSLQGRHSRVKVTWFNPEDGYRAAIEFVEDDEMLDRFGDNDAEIYAVGCTSRGQAVRHGRWFLDNERFASRTLSYTAALDQALVRPGDLISVLDDSIAGLRMGGRIAGVATGATHTITLDNEFEFESGKSYTLEIVLPVDQPIDPDDEFDLDPDDEFVEDVNPDNKEQRHAVLEKLNVTNPPETTDVVTLDGLYSTTPLAGAMFALSEPTLVPSQWRVLGLKEIKAGAQYQVNAVQHDPNKYGRIESDLDLPSLDISNLPTGPILPPTELDCVETLFEPGNVQVASKVTLSWTAANDTRVTLYEAQMKRPSVDTWEAMGTPSGGNDGFIQGVFAEGLNIAQGVYDFRVRSYDNFSRKSQWVPKTEALLGLGAPPGDVENFRTTLQTDQVELHWDRVTDLDMRGYVIRFSPLLVGATWAGAQPLGIELSKDSLSKSILGIVGTYLIKAVDTTDNESRNAAVVIITSLGDIGLNQVALFEEHPAWAGVKTNTEVVGGNLQLKAAGTMADWIPLAIATPLAGGAGFSPTGQYDAFNTIDLGAVYFSRISSELHVTGVNLSNVMASWVPLSFVSNLAGVVEGEVDVIVEYRSTEDDPGGSPVWTAWQEMVTTEVKARAFEFRLILSTTKTHITPVVTFWAIMVDMPDRVESGEDIAVLSAGSTISFVPPFLSPRPALTVTGQDLNDGDYMVLTETSIDRNEFFVQFFNGVTGIAANIDYIARGWGAEL